MESEREFLRDILGRVDPAWEHVLVKRGGANVSTSQAAAPSRPLRELAMTHKLGLIEGDGYLAISGYDITTDSTTYRIDRVHEARQGSRVRIAG